MKLDSHKKNPGHDATRTKYLGRKSEEIERQGEYYTISVPPSKSNFDVSSSYVYTFI